MTRACLHDARSPLGQPPIHDHHRRPTCVVYDDRVRRHPSMPPCRRGEQVRATPANRAAMAAADRLRAPRQSQPDHATAARTGVAPERPRRSSRSGEISHPFPLRRASSLDELLKKDRFAPAPLLRRGGSLPALTRPSVGAPRRPSSLEDLTEGAALVTEATTTPRRPDTPATTPKQLSGNLGAMRLNGLSRPRQNLSRMDLQSMPLPALSENATAPEQHFSAARRRPGQRPASTATAKLTAEARGLSCGRASSMALRPLSE